MSSIPETGISRAAAPEPSLPGAALPVWLARLRG